MEITLQELLKGKSTIIKNNEYYPTAAYVEPFLEKMSNITEDFRIQVKTPNQITKDDDLKDITYNRVVIQAVLPDELIAGHSQVVGLVYGIDIKKPVVKFYTGALDMVCTNLCVFDPEQLFCSELEPTSAIDYKPLDSIIDHIQGTAEFIQRLQNTEFDCSYQHTSECLGNWIKQCMKANINNNFGKVKIATSVPIDAYKLLFTDTDSRYYTKDIVTNMYNVYGAFTQIITDNLSRDMLNQCEKTLLVKQILNI